MSCLHHGEPEQHKSLCLLMPVLSIWDSWQEQNAAITTKLNFDWLISFDLFKWLLSKADWTLRREKLFLLKPWEVSHPIRYICNLFMFTFLFVFFFSDPNLYFSRLRTLRTHCHFQCQPGSKKHSQTKQNTVERTLRIFVLRHLRINSFKDYFGICPPFLTETTMV